jgi:hypothetical protein
MSSPAGRWRRGPKVTGRSRRKTRSIASVAEQYGDGIRAGAAMQLGISMQPIRRSHPRLGTDARNDLTASFRERMNIPSLALLHTSADVSRGRTLKNEGHITGPLETQL